MKMNNIMKALTLAVALFVNVMYVSARVYDNNLIHNTEEKDGVMTAQTVYKVEGNTLTNYMKYSYSYDEQKRMTENTAYKWNDAQKSWDNDLRITYTYSGKTVTTNYFKWNAKSKTFVLVPEMTVTMDNNDM